MAEFVDVRCDPALVLTCDCTAPALRLCPAGTVVMVLPETTTTDPADPANDPEGRVLCALATGVMGLPETATTDADADDAAELSALGADVATPLQGPGFSSSTQKQAKLDSRGGRSLTRPVRRLVEDSRRRCLRMSVRSCSSSLLQNRTVRSEGGD
jgi:hypothetical protein